MVLGCQLERYWCVKHFVLFSVDHRLPYTCGIKTVNRVGDVWHVTSCGWPGSVRAHVRGDCQGHVTRRCAFGAWRSATPWRCSTCTQPSVTSSLRRTPVASWCGRQTVATCRSCACTTVQQRRRLPQPRPCAAARTTTSNRRSSSLVSLFSQCT